MRLRAASRALVGSAPDLVGLGVSWSPGVPSGPGLGGDIGTMENIAPAEIVEVLYSGDEQMEVTTPADDVKKRARELASSSGSATASAKKKKVIRRLDRSNVDLDDSAWEDRENPGARSDYVRAKKRAVPSRITMGLTDKQHQLVRSKIELFGVSSPANIAADASHELDLAEKARFRSTNIKGDLSQDIKCGIAVAREALYELAKRAMGAGGPSDTELRDKVRSLAKERDELLLQVEELRKRLDRLEGLAGSRAPSPSASGERGEEEWVTCREEAGARSVSGPSRRRSARLRIVSSMESEGVRVAGAAARPPLLPRGLLSD